MKANGEFIRSFEGFSAIPYICPGGVPTIGFGSTLYPNGKKVTMKDKPITLARALELSTWHQSLFEADVTSLVKRALNENQFTALVDFAYNIGSDIDADDIPEGLGDSTLLKKINANPSDPSIRTEFLKWNYSKGKPSRGLTIRRGKEADLYFTPIIAPHPTYL